jgi:hypothetical protein
VSANDLAIAQVVIVMDEAVVERFEWGVTNHFYPGRIELGECSFQGSFDDFRRSQEAVSFGIVATCSAWGKLDEAHSLETKKDFSCRHVFEVSVGLEPLPFSA